MKLDSETKQDVLAELQWDAEVDESKIGVTVTNGAVTLTGHVPSYRQKLAAKRATRRVAGVLAVVDKTEVLLESEHRATDEGLAERIANVLTWNVAVPNSIKAEVAKGGVTLTGEVEWHYQRANILKNVEHVGGVIDVVNFISIKPRVAAADVQHSIRSALQRHADVEAAKIAIDVSNGTVTLSGTVDSMAEMDRVEAAAWAASGVTQVVDNLRVV